MADLATPREAHYERATPLVKRAFTRRHGVRASELVVTRLASFHGTPALRVAHPQTGRWGIWVVVPGRQIERIGGH
jgi:hypothetical protein